MDNRTDEQKLASQPSPLDPDKEGGVETGTEVVVGWSKGVVESDGGGDVVVGWSKWMVGSEGGGGGMVVEVEVEANCGEEDLVKTDIMHIEVRCSCFL